MDALALALLIADAAEERKAADVMVMDLRELTVVADYFVLASGRTPTQVRAISDYIQERTGKVRVRPRHREGYERGRWVLLDYGDVVVHILCEQERKFYALERLWGDAPVARAAGEGVPQVARRAGAE